MGHFGIRTRKSAFFLSFSITTMALCVLFGSLLLFWQGAEEKTVGNPQSVAMENPDERLLADRRENLLCTVWDGDTPLLVTVLGLYPEARSITVFCLPMGLATSVAGEPMTLGELYGYGGKQLQKEAVEEATGLIVSRQVSMDVNGVRSLVDATGALRYSVAIGTSAEHITITPGDRVLDGSKVYAYLKGLAELPEERAEEALEEQSRLVQELIRQKFKEYKAQRKGVTCGVYDESHVDEFYQLMKVTGDRDGFIIRPKEYFVRMLRELGPEHCRLYLCYYEGKAISGAITTQYAGKTCYVYGASDNAMRNVMPNHLMQWTMMNWAMENGNFLYDFQGIPHYQDEDHPNYGVYRFKKGFGGQVVSFAGEFDYVFSPGFKKFVDFGEQAVKALRHVQRKLTTSGGD